MSDDAEPFACYSKHRMDRFVKSTRVDPSGASSSKRKAPGVSTRPILISLHHASSELVEPTININ